MEDVFLDDIVVACFFFKQKTAYEMRISDWSSDVCSSDLGQRGMPEPTTQFTQHLPGEAGGGGTGRTGAGVPAGQRGMPEPTTQFTQHCGSGCGCDIVVGAIGMAGGRSEIGRAHVCTPVTNAHLVCRRPLDTTNHTWPDLQSTPHSSQNKGRREKT